MKKDLDRRGFLKAGAGALAAFAGTARPARAEELNPPYPIPDEPVTAADYRALKEKTKAVYERNRVKVAEGYFHMPSMGKYSSLFGWDSGWHAIAMTRIDPALAASELEVLTIRQEANGRISHNTRFSQLEEKQKEVWYSRIVHNMGETQYDEQGRSAMIDPPSYLLAAEKVYAATQDRAWLDKILPRLEACIHYLTHERDLFGDGLVSVIHPWETGTDSSSAYDKILHLDFHTPLGAPARGLKYNRMLEYNAQFHWDPQVAKQKNRFILEDLAFNSITIRGIQAIANLNEQIGHADQAAALRQQAANMMAAIDRINWVEKKGCYYSRYDAKRPKLAMRTTCASLLPLLTGLVAKERAQRVIREHLLNPEQFWLTYVFPFNAADEMKHDKVYLEDLVLWRGHCIWINMNYLIMEGLLHYGLKQEARELTRRTAKMIRHEGLWEFYDYRNGQGKGQSSFNWPGLVLEMIHRTWPEAVI
jgi:glycogen debranching enzyme